MDNQVKDAEKRIADFKMQLKEKEQENRISKLKLKDLKRTQKHNQLTPLKAPKDSSSVKKPPKTIQSSIAKETTKTAS